MPINRLNLWENLYRYRDCTVSLSMTRMHSSYTCYVKSLSFKIRAAFCMFNLNIYTARINKRGLYQKYNTFRDTLSAEECPKNFFGFIHATFYSFEKNRLRSADTWQGWVPQGLQGFFCNFVNGRIFISFNCCILFGYMHITFSIYSFTHFIFAYYSLKKQNLNLKR